VIFVVEAVAFVKHEVKVLGSGLQVFNVVGLEQHALLADGNASFTRNVRQSLLVKDDLSIVVALKRVFLVVANHVPLQVAALVI